MASMKSMGAGIGMLIVETIAKIRRAYFVQSKRSAEAVQVGRGFHGMRASSSRLDHPLVMRSRVSLSQA